MNDRERDQYKPLCGRCGVLVLDVDWVDITTFDGQAGYLPGRMRCDVEGCYDVNGDRATTPLVPGGLTVDDRRWLDDMRRLANER